MVNIFIGDYTLDIYDEDIQFNWSPFMFQTKLKDQYTNNFTIPKTINNLKALGVNSILDAPIEPQFGKEIENAVFQINNLLLNISLRVVSINEKDIEICIFENSFNSIDKNTTINEYLTDSSSTIYEWNKWSMTNYPNNFCSYYYGFPYTYQLAQRHPYIKLIDLLNKVDLKGYTIQWDNTRDWRILASNKVVCPQNRRQVIEYNNFGSTEENGLLSLMGGQHVSNDLSLSKTQNITFNRDCKVSMKIWCMWRKTSPGDTETIFLQKNNNAIYQFKPGGSQGVSLFLYNFDVKKDDVLSFYCNKIQSYNKSFSMIVRMDYSDYIINDDDYSKELEYIYRLPELHLIMGTNTLETYEMNGVNQQTSVGTIQSSERLSFAYFGLYCNIPKMKLGDVFYSLQWLIGGKLQETYDKQLIFNQVLEEYNKDQSNRYDNDITNVIISCDKLGRSNYLKYKDDEEAIPITTIDNIWLEQEKILHEVCFHSIKDCIIDQYSIELKKDIDYQNIPTWTDIFDLKFNKIEAPVLFNYNSNAELRYRAEQIPIKTMGIEEINSSKEVDFVFYDVPLDFIKQDILYIDGRTYYVIEGNYDIQKASASTQCLLVKDSYCKGNFQATNIRRLPSKIEVDFNVTIESSTPLIIANIECWNILNPTSVLYEGCALVNGDQVKTVELGYGGAWCFKLHLENVNGEKYNSYTKQIMI